MGSKIFPSTDHADEDGLLVLGGGLYTEVLLDAYSNGIFPWPLNRKVLAWFAPPNRCILKTDSFHTSRSFIREIKKVKWQVRFNTNFESVIQLCATRGGKGKPTGTWITPAIVKAYSELHRMGVSHSVECYNESTLIGGLYGISIGGMFAAESMFHIESEASKVCVFALAQTLHQQGIKWLDAQVMNPFLAKLGFEEIPREKFEGLLSTALKASKFLPPVTPIEVSALSKLVNNL